jgi:hypothetical protein
MRIGENPDVVTTFDLSPQVPDNRSTTPAAHNPDGSANNGCNEPTSSYSWLGIADVGAGGASGLDLHADIAANITGEQVRADHTVWDNGNDGNQISDPAGTADDSNWYTTSGTTNTAINFSLEDGHQYAWTVSAEVQGIPNGSDGPYTTPAGTNCGFNVDLSPPSQPVVTSAAFPPTGGTTYDGQSGQFNFTATDPVPTGCTPGPVPLQRRLRIRVLPQRLHHPRNRRRHHPGRQ